MICKRFGEGRSGESSPVQQAMGGRAPGAGSVGLLQGSPAGRLSKGITLTGSF